MGAVESNEEPSEWLAQEKERLSAEQEEASVEETKSEVFTIGNSPIYKRKFHKSFKGRGDEIITNHLLSEKAKQEDFVIEKYIGQGAYGKVMKVHHKKTKKVYAMKMLEKDYIRKNNQVLNIFTERGILSELDNPFIVSLQYSFQSRTKLYFVMDYCSGGDFFGFLRIKRKFTEGETRFYAGEIALALDCLHRNNIVYRDLKPENMLLDQTGHIKMTDFGLSKNLNKENLMKTFCGSTTYLAPEVIISQTREKGYTKSVDWWSYGVMFYEMLTGLPAFYDRNVQMNYVKIMYANIPMNKNFSRSCRSLIFDLLEKDPRYRIQSFSEVKNHDFFKSLNWEDLYNLKIEVPLKPNWVVKEEGPLKEVLDEYLVRDDAVGKRDSIEGDFKDFSYQKPSSIGLGRGETYVRAQMYLE